MAGETQGWIDAAKETFDGAGDVIKDATVKRLSGTDDYVPGTGITPAETTSDCRVLFDLDRQYISTYFKDMVIEPNIHAMIIEGSSFAPIKGDILTIDGRELTLQFVDNVASLGAIYIALGQ